MPDQMTTRSLGPVTFDEKKNSVRAVAATEKPVRVWDWQQYDYVDEVLRMDGMILPESGRVPLLDCHSRYGVKSVLGSAGDFQESTAGGFRAIEPEVTYSETEEGKSAAQKTREGHLTDYSVGYGTRESFWVPDGQKQIIAGDEYEGPVKVVTSWELRELSATPIGADEYAKARSKYLNEKERNMPGEHHPTNPVPKDPGAVPQGGRGQGGEPTPPEPVRSEPTQATGPTQEDVTRAATDSQTSERSRVMDILKRCSVAGMADAAQDFIERGLTLDQVSDAIFQRMADGNPPVGAGRTQITADARDKFRSAAVDGLALRAGLAVDKPAPGHGDFRGRSLLQIGEESLTVAGENLRGMGKMEMAARILNMPVQGLRSGSTSDFPLIMSNVANKRLLTAWEGASVTWDIFCNVVDATDFKPIQGIDISALPELALINERGEYKDVQVDETGASYFVKTFGNMFRLTRHMVINDDLRAFQKIPMMFGSAAKRTINNHVFALLNGNTKLADGKPIFWPDHKNLMTEAVGAPNKASLSEGRKLMRGFMDPGGKAKLNLQAKYLVAGSQHETDIEVILLSPGATDDNKSAAVINPFKGKLTPVIDSTQDTYDENAWFLFPDKTASDAIEVAFLDGIQTPYLEDMVDFDTDGIKYKCRIDFGCGAMSHRIVKNPGK